MTETLFDGHIGIDEAGRGCLAGPVTAAAVLFVPGFAFAEVLPGLDDSKKLTAKTRGKLATLIKRHCVCWRVGLSWPNEIDAVNILNATFRAMSRAASRLRLPLPLPPLVIDGNHVIRENAWRAVSALPLPEQHAVIDGDALVPCIAAASILAKTFRDALMEKLDAKYAGYGFAAHKGYGTAMHRRVIRERGPCAMHRMTFGCVRANVEQLSLFSIQTPLAELGALPQTPPGDHPLDPDRGMDCWFNTETIS